MVNNEQTTDGLHMNKMHKSFICTVVS